MDNYKEMLTELNDIILKISDFEKELIVNKEKVDYSISKTKEYIDNQILQFKENKENFQTSIQLIEDKYKNILKDIHNKIEIDFQEIINDKLDRMKSVLNPLEIELKESNVEISRIKNFIDNDFRNEFIKNQHKMEEINKILIKKSENNFRINQDEQLRNIESIQNKTNERLDVLYNLVDRIIDNQKEILKTLK